MSEQESPKAGWYQDPSSPLEERYWDGITWTVTKRPLVPLASSVSHSTSSINESIVNRVNTPLKRQTKLSISQRLLVVGFVVTVFGILLSIIGSQTPKSTMDNTLQLKDNQYLAIIASDFTQSKLITSQKIEIGHAVCSDLSSGTTGLEEMGVAQKSVGLSQAQAISVIGAAVNVYCPENKAIALSH